jgi:hypothetical protein
MAGAANGETGGNGRTLPPRRIARRSRAWLLFAVGWLIWQLGLPLVKLVAPRPARFGWQMFSGGEPLRFFVRRGDGVEVEVSPLTVLAVPRPEIRAERELAAAFCAADPRAEAIRVQVGRDGARREVPCR